MRTCSVCHFLVLLFCSNAIPPGLALQYDLQRFEQEIKPDKILDFSKFKIIRIKKGSYGFDGPVGLLQDLGSTTTIDVRLLYSSNGVEAYKMLPHHIGPKDFCNFLNMEYKKYVPDLPKHSNFPQIGDQYFCPLKKGSYKVDNYEWDPSVLPSIFKPGFYKLQLKFSQLNGDTSITNIIVKVTLK